MIVKIRFDAADYSWDGPENGWRGHDDRLRVEWYDGPNQFGLPVAREHFNLTPEGIAEMLEVI